ncbi:hypothetical protein EGW08_021851 [Elysia chlorotica]|uniref:Uncharacterized protein n=1 Tax=Elysia chlorotica TaxID=188477 RepID=A0A433SMK0_ELYCH|nr:hypothetical protein EGW08_021851 [Elysia chlorotica]
MYEASCELFSPSLIKDVEKMFTALAFTFYFLIHYKLLCCKVGVQMLSIIIKCFYFVERALNKNTDSIYTISADFFSIILLTLDPMKMFVKFPLFFCWLIIIRFPFSK